MQDNSILKRKERADYMREWYRSNGCMPVKGVFINCARCGNLTEKQHFSHDYCANCVKPAQLERRRAKRAATGTVSIGTQFSCKNCGIPVIKVNKRQFYCQPCAELSAKSALPDARRVQLEYQKARNKRLRRDNPSVAISERITAQIGCAIRSKKAGRKWESLVGYTLHDLMTHLERQFLKGMTWENRDKWHIDHILPISGFNLDLGDDEIKRAWGLPNLRPMWAADNIRKSGHRLHLC